ncbi:MAG TPA: hypothetical protein DCM87_12255, partial [Planctomycetes bacterium]|nr:hypothetical protein [Planctomycetota bacterium]
MTPEEERPGEPEAEALLPVPAEERDRPNPPALVRKVLLRDGLTCANPRCGRKVGLQAHHIRFRANGGKTALENECALCPTCHALAHSGLLRIEGDPLTGLVWKPKCGDRRLSLGEELSRATTVAEVRVRPVYEDPPDSTVVEEGGGLSYST